MRDKLVDKIIINIKNNNKDFSEIKLAEIRYGLQGLYSIITKTSVIIILSLILGIFKEFIIFLLFYAIIRAFGYGVHANSNLKCWIFSTLFLLGYTALFYYSETSLKIKIIIWIIIFINFIVFSPADTIKRPMINKKRKIKFKFLVLLISIVYLFLIIYFKRISGLILGAMCLEGLLVNPLGYIIMGEKVRFSLNDIYFKRN